MTGARFIVGDVFDVLATLPDGSVDLVLTSPPFLALRSYLPAGHADKAREIGSEATPADYLDVLLELTAEWGRVLAPHGSIAVELGDTYADGGLRDGQRRYDGTATKDRRRPGDYPVRDDCPRPARDRTRRAPAGWPMEKSLCGVPTLYAWSLAYGRNLLTGEASPAGMWRIRTVKPWIRTNPPVGALGDKERPATSYVIVATKAADRWFDLDAVRVRAQGQVRRNGNGPKAAAEDRGDGKSTESPHFNQRVDSNTAGVPPLDWYHEVDAVLDAALREHAAGTSHARTAKGIDQRENSGKAASPGRGGQWATLGIPHGNNGTVRGWHLRRALEAAGYLSTAEALDVTAKGYRGAHYAVWPPELCRLLIEEMCPRRVCRTCGQPSRRLTNGTVWSNGGPRERDRQGRGRKTRDPERLADYGGPRHGERRASPTTTGWTACGCPGTDALRLDGHHPGDGWRPGLVLDPFAGSGTTLMVATGHGRDAIGIDLDARNADLALDRVGPMFLNVEHHSDTEVTAHGQ